MRKKILSVLGILVFAGLIYGVYRNSSVEETDTSISKTGFYFDTVIKITLYNSDDADYLDGCFALADKYENLLSATIESSDVSKINAANGSPVTVSPETAELIREGIDYGTLSSGQFDITIGKLSLGFFRKSGYRTGCRCHRLCGIHHQLSEHNGVRKYRYLK